MPTIVKWIVQNWKWIAIIGVGLIILYITKPITETLRGAKEGLAEATKPLGFTVFVILVILAVWLFSKLEKLF